MRIPRASLLCWTVALVTGCATVGHRGDGPRLAGTYAVRLAITGRSTYTGTLTITRWAGDSAFGALRLVAPLAVEVAVHGVQSADTLRLRGSYSAANGCTGTLDAPLIVTGGAQRATGPATLEDKCVGALRGTMELSR